MCLDRIDLSDEGSSQPTSCHGRDNFWLKISSKRPSTVTSSLTETTTSETNLPFTAVLQLPLAQISSYWWRAKLWSHTINRKPSLLGHTSFLRITHFNRLCGMRLIYCAPDIIGNNCPDPKNSVPCRKVSLSPTSYYLEKQNEITASPWFLLGLNTG
jgi:hypothetical protein